MGVDIDVDMDVDAASPAAPARAVGELALLPPIAAEGSAGVPAVEARPAALICCAAAGTAWSESSLPLSAAEQPASSRPVSAAVAGTMHALSASRRERERKFLS